MDVMVYALVDRTGMVYTDDTAPSYAAVAKKHEVDEQACDLYRFDLVERQVLQDRGTAASRRAAREHFNRDLGSPDKLMTAAQQGRWSKDVLARLLPTPDRGSYLDACSAIERRYTESCASGETCLASGCSMDEDDRCLQPLLRAGAEYQRACAAEWVKWFARPHHRIEAWRHEA